MYEMICPGCYKKLKSSAYRLVCIACMRKWEIEYQNGKMLKTEIPFNKFIKRGGKSVRE